MVHVETQSAPVAVNPSPQPAPDLAIHTSHWRGILLVEPDLNLLAAEVLVLTSSNYSVTPAFNQIEIIALRETKAIALAILSDCLGPARLAAVAQTVRKQWPLARILILGRPGSLLEDFLYDEQIDHSSNPEQLPEDIDCLYSNAWNQRSNTLDWDLKRANACAARPRIRESDPTKNPPLPPPIELSHLEMPSGIRYRPR